MKAIFVAFDQAHYDNIMQVLTRLSQRGFTYWENVQGRGSKNGEPHLGSHAWPSTNSSLMLMVEDEKVDSVLNALQALDKSKEALGLRAFVMNVEKTI
ncbi:MAG: P-II family nitrogen regulator [Bacteroidales bacterium]|nr:P-II family nitrogen regulator [Bacteroidales bacterium]